MKTSAKKEALLKSIEHMQKEEMEQVLKYIKHLLYHPMNDANYQKLKAQAMDEIKLALESDLEV